MMKNTSDRLTELLQDELGASATEYAVLVLLIILVALAAIGALGFQVDQAFKKFLTMFEDVSSSS